MHCLLCRPPAMLAVTDESVPVAVVAGQRAPVDDDGAAEPRPVADAVNQQAERLIRLFIRILSVNVEGIRRDLHLLNDGDATDE